MKKHNNDHDDDDGDSCVFIGTPLVDLLDEDVKFSVKPKRPDEQIVTDEKGRQRFHGAFTGGFSAGYFNSVGTKEGWAPSTFKSTRGERVDKKSFHKPEDFMDEEDFSEHGIAPKTLKIKSDYKDEGSSATSSYRKRENVETSLGFSLDDIVKPVVSTMGVKMLRKMGWRDGQGVGPKIKRKLRSLKAKIAHEPGRKIYGVALPPSESDESDEENADDDHQYLVSAFDINEFQFVIKENLFGLGYKRLDVSNLFGNENSSKAIVNESPAASLLFPMGVPGQKKKGITGQSFGYGEFEDEEDVDIYKQDSIDTYDFGLDKSDKKKGNATQKLLNKSYGFGAFDDDVSILKKFFESKLKQMPAKTFAPPQIPKDFNFMHKLDEMTLSGDNSEKNGTENASMNAYLKTATDRGQVLGETPLRPESVFDLIRPADREFLLEKKQQLFSNASIGGGTKPPAETSPSPPPQAKSTSKEMKAKRYEQFISFNRKNFKDPYSFVDTTGLTEWEKESEKEEFFSTYEKSMRKIDLIKSESLKFVSTSLLNEQNEEMNIEKPLETTSSVSAIVKPTSPSSTGLATTKEETKKVYGKETRVEYEWRPHPTVCKRFNVPCPYTDNIKEYGTVRNDKFKAPKFSLFNVLSAGTRFDKEKTKSLFDELNADAPTVRQATSKPMLVMMGNIGVRSDGKSETNDKIEFETKTVDDANKGKDTKRTSLKFETPMSQGDEMGKESVLKEDYVIKSNVYLQDRPSFDLFKAIFENEDDLDEEKNENSMEKESDSDVEVIPDDDDHHHYNSVKLTEPKMGQIETTVSSSLDKIKYRDLSKYLDPEPEREKSREEGERAISFAPSPALPEKIKFTQLVKSLATKGKKTSSDEDDDDDDDSKNLNSSEDSDSDEIQIVYEEVSISSNKKSHHHLKKKSKKKKKKKSKKSKKSSE